MAKAQKKTLYAANGADVEMTPGPEASPVPTPSAPPAAPPAQPPMEDMTPAPGPSGAPGDLPAGIPAMPGTPQPSPTPEPSPEPAPPPTSPQEASKEETPKEEEKPAPKPKAVQNTVPTAELPPDPMTMTAQQEALHMIADSQKFAQDLQYGAVQPKTYHDLYADKSTLGKIGTIFGLMVSGAGSGLTGQPNALLEMMNKQIERDVEAQKTNQGNKQNWYKLAMEHDRNMAGNQLTGMQTAQFANDVDRQKAINAQMGIKDLSATTKAANMASVAAIQELQDAVNKYPPGPMRDAAQQKLDTVIRPALDNQIAQRSLDTAQKKRAISAANPMPPNPPPVNKPAVPGVKYDAVNEPRLNAMFQKGRILGEEYAGKVPGAIPPSLQPTMMQEVQTLKTLRNTRADFEDAFQRLAHKTNAGQSPSANIIGGAIGTVSGLVAGLLTKNPTAGAAVGTAGSAISSSGGSLTKDYFERERSQLVDRLSQAMGKDAALINTFLPNWTDNDKTKAQAYEQMTKFFQNQENQSTPYLKQFGLAYPMPKYQMTPAPAKKGK